MLAVGKNIPHDSAIGYVTGTAEYIPDIPKVEGELVVDFFYSFEPHGQILNIDLEDARKIPDIVGLYTYKDIKGENQFGPIIKDEVLLVESIVEYFGQPIVIDKNFPFLGVIGSKAKAVFLRKQLQLSGVSEELSSKFYCPMGLPLGTNQP